MRKNIYIDIQPGDIGFTKGGGIVGWVIRHGTGSAYAHSFVYHKKITLSPSDSHTWQTVEAFPSLKKQKDGVQFRIRTEQPDKVVRICRTSQEREALLAYSAGMVGTGYGWGEIFRIALRFVGIKVKGWESNRRAICSNHCTQSIQAARKGVDVFFSYKPSLTWPGELATTLDAITWGETRVSERLKRLRNGK
jgi:hypothetical protein